VKEENNPIRVLYILQ